jgi:hypothetical protein
MRERVMPSQRGHPEVSPGAPPPRACRARVGMPAKNDVPPADRHRVTDGFAPPSRAVRIPIPTPAVAATDRGRRRRDGLPGSGRRGTALWPTDSADLAHPEAVARRNRDGRAGCASASRRSGRPPTSLGAASSARIRIRTRRSRRRSTALAGDGTGRGHRATRCALCHPSRAPAPRACGLRVAIRVKCPRADLLDHGYWQMARRPRPALRRSWMQRLPPAAHPHPPQRSRRRNVGGGAGTGRLGGGRREARYGNLTRAPASHRPTQPRHGVQAARRRPGEVAARRRSWNGTPSGGQPAHIIGCSRPPPAAHPHPHAGGPRRRTAGAGMASGCARRVIATEPAHAEVTPGAPAPRARRPRAPAAARHRAHHGCGRLPPAAQTMDAGAIRPARIPVRALPVATTDRGRRESGSSRRRTCATGVQAPRVVPAPMDGAPFDPARIPSARRRSGRRTAGGGRRNGRRHQPCASA